MSGVPGAAAAEGADGGGSYVAADAGDRICSEWLGGGPGSPARPSFVVHVDLERASAAAAGTVELGVRGPLPRLSAATLERLVGDADLRAVIFDGARPLAVSGKVRAGDIPARTRIAVAARDRGFAHPTGGVGLPVPRLG